MRAVPPSEPRARSTEGALAGAFVAPASHKRHPLAEVRALGACIGCPKGYDRSLLFERHIPFLRVGGTKGRLMPADRETWREAHDLETVR